MRLTASPAADTDAHSMVMTINTMTSADTRRERGSNMSGSTHRDSRATNRENRDRDRDNRDRESEVEAPLDGLPKKPTELERATYKVIEYLSASNWNLVYHTFSIKLKTLRTTAADDSDATSLSFISHLHLNSKKLSLLLQEIGGSFLPLRKAPQNTLASLLPETIQRWIDARPGEFVDLHVANRRLEGGAEILFDLATGLVDGTKRRGILWPLQTSLVLLLPDVFWVLEMRGEQRGGSFAKKVAFLSNLRQSLRLPRSSDIAASCLITICRAGALFPAESESALLSFALDVQNDITDEIFKRQGWGGAAMSVLNGTNGKDGGKDEAGGREKDGDAVDRDIMIKAFVSSARLNVESVVEGLLPRCLDRSSPVGFKVTVFAGVAVLATQVGSSNSFLISWVLSSPTWG